MTLVYCEIETTFLEHFLPNLRTPGKKRLSVLRHQDDIAVLSPTWATLQEAAMPVMTDAESRIGTNLLFKSSAEGLRLDSSAFAATGPCFHLIFPSAKCSSSSHSRTGAELSMGPMAQFVSRISAPTVGKT